MGIIIRGRMREREREEFKGERETPGERREEREERGRWTGPMTRKPKKGRAPAHCRPAAPSPWC